MVSRITQYPMQLPPGDDVTYGDAVFQDGPDLNGNDTEIRNRSSFQIGLSLTLRQGMNVLRYGYVDRLGTMYRGDATFSTLIGRVEIRDCSASSSENRPILLAFYPREIRQIRDNPMED